MENNNVDLKVPFIDLANVVKFEPHPDWYTSWGLIPVFPKHYVWVFGQRNN